MMAASYQKKRQHHLMRGLAASGPAELLLPPNPTLVPAIDSAVALS